MAKDSDLQLITQSAHTDFAITRVFSSHEYLTSLDLLNALQKAEGICEDSNWSERKRAFIEIGSLTTMRDACGLKLEDTLAEIIDCAQALDDHLGSNYK